MTQSRKTSAPFFLISSGAIHFQVILTFLTFAINNKPVRKNTFKGAWPRVPENKEKNETITMLIRPSRYMSAGQSKSFYFLTHMMLNLSQTKLQRYHLL